MATMWREFGASLLCPKENQMKRFYAKCAMVAVAALGGWSLLTPAQAAPPTVTPSPGYDARLQQQRAALTAAPAPTPMAPRVKRRHRSAH
jgi:hypothetical protein